MGISGMVVIYGQKMLVYGLLACLDLELYGGMSGYDGCGLLGW